MSSVAEGLIGLLLFIYPEYVRQGNITVLNGLFLSVIICIPEWLYSYPIVLVFITSRLSHFRFLKETQW